MTARINHIRTLLQKEFSQTQIISQGNDLVLPLEKSVTITFSILENEILIAPNNPNYFGWRHSIGSKENQQVLKLAEERIKRVFSLAKLDCVMMHYIGS